MIEKTPYINTNRPTISQRIQISNNEWLNRLAIIKIQVALINQKKLELNSNRIVKIQNLFRQYMIEKTTI